LQNPIRATKKWLHQIHVDSDENEITITHGYSKDHRPDLKQAVLELVTSQDDGIPLMMKCFDGNASDNKIFKERCKELLTLFKKGESPRYLVGDSKLYHEDNAINLAEIKFITRIPRIYKEERKTISTAIAENCWVSLGEENAYAIHKINHLSIAQRWIVVRSTALKLRYEVTLNKKIEKEYQEAKSALKHLKNKEFSCAHDAKKELSRISSTFKYHEIILTKVCAQSRYEKIGRPKKTAEPTETIYQIEASIVSLFLRRKEMLMQHSCYIIGTNSVEEELSAEEVIEAYKNQNASVERGFRFLKDPQFFVSSFFLKKPARIMSLLMIMTLSLLVYSVTQKYLRQKLEEKNETLPNQINVPIKNPTMRWIFQLMEGIDVVYVKVKGVILKKMTGITKIRQKIISFLFESVQKIYQTAEMG
jgi:transposase